MVRRKAIRLILPLSTKHLVAGDEARVLPVLERVLEHVYSLIEVVDTSIVSELLLCKLPQVIVKSARGGVELRDRAEGASLPRIQRKYSCVRIRHRYADIQTAALEEPKACVAEQRTRSGDFICSKHAEQSRDTDDSEEKEQIPD
jgi:hypothetical protein